MTKTTTIQISVYDWYLKHEYIYETQIGSVEDLISLSSQFNKKVKYKKPTDINWYYSKTMIKRLFKKEIASAEYPEVKLVATNDLNKLIEERHQEKLKKEKERLEYEKMMLEFEERKYQMEVSSRNLIF
ncbi:hypothetical protein [Ureibacillus aquaedulcis]|uniref:Uncharacterized protein n=1 Tax=Ureibacillus aquaedulcis TaxID=3058421 RepID=A0ABT8GPM3_9BACL|nr:hypothetical protein [Ureibacillus sp. BA0131]MDN4493359.1 hypothetical protein [Ureibacillus sp. BA0131]